MTAGFAIVISVLFAAIGIGLYLTVAAALLDEVDTGLRLRMATVRTDELAHLNDPGTSSRGLVEPGEGLVQVLATDSTVLQTSPASLPDAVLSAHDIQRVTAPTTFQRKIPGIADTARLLAVPGRVGARPVVIVAGASMQDRADTLRLVTLFLGIAAPLAVLLASAAGWRIAGTALNPVERMRRQASAVAVSGLDRRLTVPPGNDEIARLGRSLNEMLDRLQDVFAAERHFLDTASHELRTPLATLRTELDLALARPRTLAQTRAALLSASQEADHLARLAEDLLVLSRAVQGQLPVHRTETSLGDLVTASVARWGPRAAEADVSLVSSVAQIQTYVDALRMRQAIDNLLDNAIRHCRPGGDVRIDVRITNGAAEISVSDDGAGFPADAPALQPDAGAQSHPAGFGLGLTIVRAIVESHGGTLRLANRPEGGAVVVLAVPVDDGSHSGPRPVNVEPGTR